jgi:hypothetical protein
MGPKEPSRWSVGPRQGGFQGFSDGLSPALGEKKVRSGGRMGYPCPTG